MFDDYAVNCVYWCNNWKSSKQTRHEIALFVPCCLGMKTIRFWTAELREGVHQKIKNALIPG